MKHLFWFLALLVGLPLPAQRVEFSAPDSVFVGDSIRVTIRAYSTSNVLQRRPALEAGTYNRDLLDYEAASYSRLKFRALKVGTARIVGLWNRADNPIPFEVTVRVVSRTPPPTLDTSYTFEVIEKQWNVYPGDTGRVYATMVQDIRARAQISVGWTSLTPEVIAFNVPDPDGNSNGVFRALVPGEGRGVAYWDAPNGRRYTDTVYVTVMPRPDTTVPPPDTVVTPPPDTTTVPDTVQTPPNARLGLLLVRDTIRVGDSTTIRLSLPDSMPGDSVRWVLPNEGVPALLDAVKSEFIRRYGQPSMADTIVIHFAGGRPDTTTRLDSLIQYTRMGEVAAWGTSWRAMAYSVGSYHCDGPGCNTVMDQRWTARVVGNRPGTQTFGIHHNRPGSEPTIYYATLTVLPALPRRIPVVKDR
jgi:hypothetical protein